MTASRFLLAAACAAALSACTGSVGDICQTTGDCNMGLTCCKRYGGSGPNSKGTCEMAGMCGAGDAGLRFDLGVRDSGTDSGADLGTDAGTDLGTDAGADLGTDAGTDLGTDAGADLGTDAGADLGTDLGTDAGAADAGGDADVDLGP